MVGGHSFLPPLVLDGDYLYLLDEVESGAGSSYSIARLPVRVDDPVLERYVAPDQARPPPSAPSFGVTSGQLYFTGYPRPDGADGRRVIVRDDDPDFSPVDGAVTTG